MAKKPLEFIKDLKAALPRLEHAIARQVVEVEARAQWAKHFRLEAFEGTSVQPWPQRKKKDKNPARRAEGASTCANYIQQEFSE